MRNGDHDSRKMVDDQLEESPVTVSPVVFVRKSHPTATHPNHNYRNGENRDDC